MARWSNPRKLAGTMSSRVPACRVMNPTSRSRSIVTSGFWTAPSRLSAAASTIVEIRFGTCQETTSPRPMPRAASPAASRSARSRNCANVTRSPPASTASRASGVSAARVRASSHSDATPDATPDAGLTGIRARRVPPVAPA